MYPDLSYVFHDLLGTPRDNWLSLFKTFGFFLLCAFLTAAWLLRRELRRREASGQLQPTLTDRVPGKTVTPVDYVINALFGFVLGYKLPYALAHLAEWQQDPAGVLLGTEGYWWSGILAAAGFTAYYGFLARRQAAAPAAERRVEVFPSDRITPITLLAAVGGLVGAKLFAVVEYLDRFVADPLGTLFSGDGLAIYGGLIGGFVAVGLYLRRHRIPLLPFMDAVAPALIVAYGVGRMGCQFSGDGDWGTQSGPVPAGWFLPDWLYSYRFPHNVLQRGVPIEGCTDLYCNQLVAGVYPTSVYETLMAFAIGGILWALRRRLTPLPGLLFALYLLLNGVERFFIEFARINDQYDVLGLSLTQAQMIAIGFVLAGLLMGGLLMRRYALPLRS